MQSKAENPEQYIQELPEERQLAMNKLREVIKENLDSQFSEEMSYGMIGYVVPKSVYPAGYHVKPELPLPFINLASQKNFIALYHMGLYADEKMLKWFEKAYAERVSTKLDMGKSCIRFKKLSDIPYELIGELVAKMNAEDWIDLYEKQLQKLKK